MSVVLPVIDLLNNVIAVNNYLQASETAKLAPSILNNPTYSALVQNFKEWQYNIWAEYFEGLIDANLTAQPWQINKLYTLDIATQDAVKNILFASSASVPGVVSLSDDVSSLIGQGEAFVTQLDEIAKSIQGADKEKVAALQKQVDALQAEFNKQEDQLTEESISSAFDVIACAIDVAIAIGSEGEDIQPLIKGVTKIGKDIITELVLTDEIQQTLKSLEAAWEALDQASLELAQITQTVNQLDAVVKTTSIALTALSNIVADWNEVANIAIEPFIKWKSSGSQEMNEWAARMIKVAFTTATQTISVSGNSYVTILNRSEASPAKRAVLGKYRKIAFSAEASGS